MSERIIDALGTYCPVPIHLVARAVAAADPGEALTLLADDPLVQIDLPAWCHESGTELLELSEARGEFRARVRRPALSPPR